MGYGWRIRKIINSDGSAQILVIHRMCCKVCGKIHHELPDIVIPYKRHCAETIEKIVSGGDDDRIPCEESAIRRIRTWWVACRLYFESVLASLREKYGAVFSVRYTPKEIVRAVVGANLWPSTRTAFLSG